MKKAYLWREPIRFPKWSRISLQALIVAFPLIAGGLEHDKIRDWVEGLSPYLVDKTASIVVTLLVLTAATAFVTAWIRSRSDYHLPFFRAAMDIVGNKIWATGPSRDLNHGLHCHRITLFEAIKLNRFKRWQYGCKKTSTHILIPRVRSPEGVSTPWRSFEFNDGDRQTVKGIAAQAWFCDSIVSEELPNMQRRDVSSSEQRRYARLAFMPLDEIQSKAPHATKIAANTVLSAGKNWGVLVLDSSDSNAIPDNVWGKISATMLLGNLTKLIENRSSQIMKGAGS